MANNSILARIMYLANLIYTETEDGGNTHLRVGEYAQKVAQMLSTFNASKSLISSFSALDSTDDLPTTPTDDEKTVCYIINNEYYLYVGEDADGNGNGDSGDNNTYKKVSNISNGSSSDGGSSSSSGTTLDIDFELDKVNKLLIMASTDSPADKYAVAIDQYVTPSTPTFSLTGLNTDTSRNLTIACGTTGAYIYYTTDGTDPTVATGTLYSGVMKFSANEVQANTTVVVKAIAVKNGLASSVATQTVVTSRQCATPVISVGGTDYATASEGRLITLTCATSGATLKYTIDGVTTTYTAPFKITASKTISVIATCSGYQDNVNTASVVVGKLPMFWEVEKPVSIPSSISASTMDNEEQKDNTDLAKGVTISPSGYGAVVFAYPKSYGALTSIKDGNNLDASADFCSSPLTVGSYYVYYMLSDGTLQTGMSYTFKK